MNQQICQICQSCVFHIVLALKELCVPHNIQCVPNSIQSVPSYVKRVPS